MSIMVSLLVCAIVGAAGTVAGWFIRQFIDNRNAPVVEEAKDSSDELNLSRSEMEALVKRLKDTAENIAFDVEEHNESMEEANSQLQSDENPTTEAVVAVLSQVIESNRRLQKQLESAEDKLFEQARVIQSQALEANTDALTLVSNRRAFDSEMAIAEE